MRPGYPWEEVYVLIYTLRSTYNWIPFLKGFPLVNTPGTKFGYSNFTAHMMGIIISRSVNESLLSFARNHLFDDMGISVPYWPADALGYYYGSGDIYLTPRSMAKFGQLYLNNGIWNNIRYISSEWIDISLQIYSPSTYGREILTYIKELGYGYMWWSGISGNHRIWFAWGHGGQMIVIIRDLNIVIVATASLPPGFDNNAWQKTKEVMELVGRFIAGI
jgi:CubicO group peptidase (beta-lactamase class C family)